jgi:hypothetical protein
MSEYFVVAADYVVDIVSARIKNARWSLLSRQMNGKNGL